MLVAGYSLLGRLKKRFRVLKTTLVFDRGMVSDNNLNPIPPLLDT